MHSVSVISPANIAFVKHWGLNADASPFTGSLSMNLDAFYTHTSLAFSDKDFDEIFIADKNNDFLRLDPTKTDRNAAAYSHLSHLRAKFGESRKIKVLSRNSFHSNIGLASSASGFSALSAGALKLLSGSWPTIEDLALATLNSGSLSALRSLQNGFSAILNEQNVIHGQNAINLKNGFYLLEIAAPKLKLLAVAVIMDKTPKHASSLTGHYLAASSPLSEMRISQTQKHLPRCIEALQNGDEQDLFNLIEQQFMLLHSVMLSSNPSLSYGSENSNKLLRLALDWKKNLSFAMTMDAGSSVYFIINEENLNKLEENLNSCGIKHERYILRPCAGTRESSNSLFKACPHQF